MDYISLANELIEMRASRQHIEIDREVSKSVKAEMFILGFLICHENRAYPKELSRAFMVSTARIAVILRRLEEKGYIIRTADQNDSRQVVVTISEKGIEKLMEYRSSAAEYLARRLEMMGYDDAVEYIRLEKKLIDVCSSAAEV